MGFPHRRLLQGTKASRQGVFVFVHTREWATGLDWRGPWVGPDLGSTEEEGAREFYALGGVLYDGGLSASQAFFSSSLSTSNSLQRAALSSPISVFVLFLRVQSHSLLCSRFPFQLAAISISSRRSLLLITHTTSPVQLYWHHEVPISCYSRSCGC